jgi:ATP-dependent Clp protease ATP-binding subunit ClpA
VFNALLQILEDGRLTDAQGKQVDFKNTVLIMTSNLGTKNLGKQAMGFAASADEEDTYTRMKAQVAEELKQHFRPEFLNRIDETIVFHQLTRAQVKDIVDLMMKRVQEQLRSKDLDIELTDDAKSWLAEKGYDAQLGARPLRRTIQREIEDALSEKILFGEYSRRPAHRRRRRGRQDRVPRRRLAPRHAHRSSSQVPEARPPGGRGGGLRELSRPADRPHQPARGARHGAHRGPPTPSAPNRDHRLA